MVLASSRNAREGSRAVACAFVQMLNAGKNGIRMPTVAPGVIKVGLRLNELGVEREPSPFASSRIADDDPSALFA